MAPPACLGQKSCYNFPQDWTLAFGGTVDCLGSVYEYISEQLPPITCCDVNWLLSLDSGATTWLLLSGQLDNQHVYIYFKQLIMPKVLF